MSKTMGLTDMPVSKWETYWMQDMGDILIRIAELNGWPTSVTLPNMFERFPPPGEEGTTDDNDENEEEETPIAPPGYERVFHLDRSSTKGEVIYNPSLHNTTQLQEGGNKSVCGVR
ncbi:hypothetical protein GOBAR_DD05708 [Gossypium barbadense]|nr:hypothetical protein GOBAR_DD05708 [Gossypium barbadense]